jgi:hypothetical protein
MSSTMTSHAGPPVGASDRREGADSGSSGDAAIDDESPSTSTSGRVRSVELALSPSALRRSLSAVGTNLRRPGSPSRPRRRSSARGTAPLSRDDSLPGAAPPAGAADNDRILSPKRVVEHARKIRRQLSNGGLQRFDFVSDTSFPASAAPAAGAFCSNRGSARDRRGSALLLQRQVRAHLAKQRAKQVSVLLSTVTCYANLAHNLTRSP